MVFYIHQARIMEAIKGYALHSSLSNDGRESTPNVHHVTLVFLGFWKVKIILTTHPFYQFQLTHFVVGYLSLLGIASLVLANILITIGVQ
jgi:hypothetical protein